MEAMPLVSIALCTYNGERFIKEQLESILGQTYHNLEIIIVDDASTDGTVDILKGFAANDKRIKLFNQPVNTGLTRNFEYAVKQCSGAYIALSDQDDIWLPNKIDKLVKAIGSDLLIYSDSELIAENGDRLGKKLSDLRHMYSGKDNRIFVFSNCVWGHCMLFKKSLTEHLFPMPPAFNHDIWIAFVASSVGSIRFLNEMLTLYRQHPDTVTNTVSPRRRLADQTSRTEFLRQLEWISLLADYPNNRNRRFFETLYRLYKSKLRQFISLSLTRFLIKHYTILYYCIKKPFIKKLNYIRKDVCGI